MKFKYISWIPAVIIMGIIFSFSSKEADTSDESSLTIANQILTVYENIADAPIQEEIRSEKLSLINHFVRKAAHFLEYTILAIAIAFHLFVWKKEGRRLFLSTVLITAFYAATDEIHQLSIAGRSGQIKDVLLDSTGAITGALLFLLFVNLVLNRNMKKEKIVMPQ